MKKQKILLGLLAIVLVANFIIPNVVLATDELLVEEEIVQEEVLTNEENVEAEEETTQEEVTANKKNAETEEEVVEAPAEVTQARSSDEIIPESNFVYSRDDIIVRMDENQAFYLPVELAETGSDTRILQSLFLIDEVGSINANKKVTLLNCDSANGINRPYRLIEDEEHPLFKVTPLDDNGNFSTTPAKYKVEFLYTGNSYSGDIRFDFTYFSEHTGFGEKYNEETGLYDKYAYYNVYALLPIHFVRHGEKAEITKNVFDEQGEKHISLRFGKDKKCVLKHEANNLNDDATFIQTILNMYSYEEKEMTTYAIIDKEFGTFRTAIGDEEPMFKIVISNAYGTIDTEYTMTITWLEENPSVGTNAELSCMDILGETEHLEDELTKKTLIHYNRYSPIRISFIPYEKKLHVYPDIIHEKGSKNVNINFDENGRAFIPYENGFSGDASFIYGLMNVFGEDTIVCYMNYDGKTWKFAEEKTDDSFVKVICENSTGDTEVKAYNLTFELLKELPENKVYTSPETYEYLGMEQTEDEENIYVTYEYNQYSPASITLVPSEKEPVKPEEPKYHVESVEINNEETTATFEFSVNYEKFLEEGTVYLDGKALEKDQYTSRKGSTIIELGKELLETLSSGTHTLKLEVSDGYVETQFDIERPTEPGTVEKAEATQPVEENPNTGDYAPIIAVLFIASVLGIAYSYKKLVISKK